MVERAFCPSQSELAAGAGPGSPEDTGVYLLSAGAGVGGEERAAHLPAHHLDLKAETFPFQFVAPAQCETHGT